LRYEHIFSIATNAIRAPRFKSTWVSGLEKDFYDEECELAADTNPGKFDFLGTEVNFQFRITKNTNLDKVALSASLAYLLSPAICDDLFVARLVYHRRDSLKGVIGGRPYPIVTIDMERNARRKEILAYERAVIKTGDACPAINATGKSTYRFS
jgi:hypothetical protein